MPEVDVLLGEIVPAVSAAVSAYGAGVLTRAEDEAAGATVRLGQRLLDRILHRSADPAPVRTAVKDLAAAADDPDALAALRLQIKKVLTSDSVLAAEMSALLPAQAVGSRSVAVVGDNTGIISTGDGATNVQRRGAS